MKRQTRLNYDYDIVPLAIRMRLSDNVSLKTNNINVNTLTPQATAFRPPFLLIFLNFKNVLRSVKTTTFNLSFCYL